MLLIYVGVFVCLFYLKEKGVSQIIGEECGAGRTFQTKREAGDMPEDNGTCGRVGRDWKQGEAKARDAFKFILRTWILFIKQWDAPEKY